MTATPFIGPLMLDLEGLTISQVEHELLASPAVGGVILFARNYDNPGQLCALVSSIRAINPHLIIAVDQEGGRVQRLKSGFTRLPPMRALGLHFEKAGEQGLSDIKKIGWLLAAEVLACDIDISFTPVLDLDHGIAEVIGDRAFGACAETIVAAGQALIDGLHEAGMACTGKHYPGHGGVIADSHHEIPIDTRKKQELEQDMIPFRQLARSLDAVMPAHVIYPAYDDKPAGFSSVWLKKLRSELGFEGVIFSDDLTMEGASVAGSFSARAEAAMVAGCDMVLVCNHRQGAEEVLEYFSRVPQVNNPRLALMLQRSKPAQSLKELQQSNAWKEAKEIVDRLNDASDTP